MKITEKNFLQEIKRKNPDAIEYVIATYGPVLKAVLWKSLCQRQDLWEECFNDVLLALWNNPERFREKVGSFQGWLCAIARYKAIDALRREERYNKNDTSIDLAANMGAYENFDGEDDEALEKLLKCLGPEDRDLFYRRYVKEERIEAIACETGISKDNIYSRLSRGKKKIRKNWEGRV